jgi:thiamine-monophosphate kinase
VKTEFEFIQNIKKSHALSAIGDDCAVLPKDSENDLLVTADLLVEDIDFRLSWTDPASLGWKALAVSLSDIAAMGGIPKWALLTLGVPEALWSSEWLQEFYNGWHQLAAQFEVELVGGDISRSADKFFVDSIVAGEVPHGQAVLRSGARPGDAIFISGSVGGAAGGLSILEKRVQGSSISESASGRLATRHSRPSPRIELGMFLRENKLAAAMIDLSDGVSSDIKHICDASRVGALIEVKRLPINADLKDLFGGEERTSLALNGGEDLELLFTVREENISVLENADVSRIGIITENVGAVELISSGSRTILPAGGYRHF